MILVHAHRGASAYAPENTIPAFRLAVQMHADAFENDIHLTKDKIYVVCHDNDISRCSNGTGRIENMTLSELKKYDFGIKYSPEFAGTSIPTLNEMLETVKDLSLFNIELKGPLPENQDLDEALTILYHLLEEFGCVEKTIISTFCHGWGKRLKELFPKLKMGLLYGESLTAKETLALADQYCADAVHPYWEGITPEIVAACKSKGILINSWTVDSPEAISKMMDLGVDGIISNVPDRVLKALGRS